MGAIMEEVAEKNAKTVPAEETILGEQQTKKEITVHKAKPTVSKKRRKHKPKDFPKRPLSAYNIFFKETREVMLRKKEAEVGKDNIDFQAMVKEIAQQWKSLDSNKKERVEKLAKDDLQRYKDEVRAYEEEMVKRNRKEREENALKKQQEEEARANELASKELQERLAAVRGSSLEALLPSGNKLLEQMQAGGVEEMRLVLQEELRVIEAAREMKLRQLAELQAGILPSSLAGAGGFAAHQAATLGLGGLQGSSLTGEAELELLRRRQALAAAGFGGLTGGAGALGGADLASMALGLGGGLVGDMGQSAALAALSRQELLRREQELLAAGQVAAAAAGATSSGGIDYAAAARTALTSELAGLGRGAALPQGLAELANASVLGNQSLGGGSGRGGANGGASS